MYIKNKRNRKRALRTNKHFKEGFCGVQLNGTLVEEDKQIWHTDKRSGPCFGPFKWPMDKSINYFSSYVNSNIN